MFCPASSHIPVGFLDSNLGSCACTTQTIYSIAEKVSKFTQLGKVSFPLTCCRVSWWGLLLCVCWISLLSQPFTLSFRSSCPNTLAPRCLISSRSTGVLMCWSSMALHAPEMCKPQFLTSGILSGTGVFSFSSAVCPRVTASSSLFIPASCCHFDNRNGSRRQKWKDQIERSTLPLL